MRVLLLGAEREFSPDRYQRRNSAHQALHPQFCCCPYTNRPYGNFSLLLQYLAVTHLIVNLKFGFSKPARKAALGKKAGCTVP
jgi:hypothetical protein